MTSSENWICDGVPKNGKTYPNCGEPHGFYSNPHDAPYCGDCGLPKESSIPIAETFSSTSKTPDLETSVPESSITNSKPPFPIKIPILLAIAIAGIVAIAGGATIYSVVNRCQPGLEKIDGQCIDPFLQPYQEIAEQGGQIINTVSDYQTVEDLERANLVLANLLEQLNDIPSEAVVYPEVAKKVEEYDKKRQEISSNIDIEKVAQEKLKEVETIATVAKKETDEATTTSQLTTAKQKWQEVQNKLQEIDKTRLVADRIQRHQSDSDKQIAVIGEKISHIEEISRIEQEQRRIRNSQKNTYVPPRKKTYTPPQKVFTPPRNKPTPRKVNPIKPKNIPHDPCAVKNPPPNCLF